MKSYKTYSTVTDSKEVLLSDLPFGSGEKVEIFIRGVEGNYEERTRQLQNLFKETQELSTTRILSEDDILLEVEAYRNGK
jgi:predicted DNA-binding antitoxin AbrB/MazE fold protein